MVRISCHSPSVKPRVTSRPGFAAPRTLVLNNSTVAGTPLLDGTLGANPNLNGRSATLIINQVTSTGPATGLYGPLEVFGAPASVVIASPNGVSVSGLSVTNVTNLTLTTGTPQFLTGVGGTTTDFAHAGAVASAYTQIADVIMTRCADPARHLEELWRR
ncbi:protein of unknown function [Burkholderia multivorans]